MRWYRYTTKAFTGVFVSLLVAASIATTSAYTVQNTNMSAVVAYYDLNHNGIIDFTEVTKAIQDWLHNSLDFSNLVSIIDAWVTNTTIKTGNVVQYAKNFQLYYDGPYKILKVNNSGSWVTYVLYQNGTSPPSNIQGIPIKIPVHRLIAMSTTHLAMLEAINATDCLVGFMYGGGYKIYFPDIAKKLEDGEIVNVGSSWSPDYEKIVELNPDLVVIYVTPYNEKVAEELKALGIPYIIDSEWLETTPLGRDEWVKFFGAITDRDYAAYMYFEHIVSNVKDVEKIVNNSVNEPKVLWLTVWSGKIYVPRGDSYVANMIKMDRGDYVFKDLPGTGSAIVDISDVLVKGQNASVLITPNYYVKNVTSLLQSEPRLSQIKAVQIGNVYNITPDYWQLGYLHTDVVVKDVAAILHPDLFPGYKPRFFVKLPSS